MKINRYKKVNRTLKFYSNHFGFRKPYQVLLDGTICVAALKNKITILDQFTKYLDGDAKLLTTQCIVKEVETLGSSASKALFVLRNFAQHHCGHEQQPIPASDCILDMVQKLHHSRYIVATQDRELQGKCRRLIGVPLLYFHLRVPTLEAPSDATLQAIQEKATDHLHVTDSKQQLPPNTEQENDIPKRKRKAKGGPNPLSCKKKKKQITRTEPRKSNGGKKKKRKHSSRLVKKIRSELLASMNAN